MVAIDPKAVCPQGLGKRKRRAQGTMRQAIDIFSYGITQLFGNFAAALRLTGLIWVLASLLIFLLGYILVGQPASALFIHPDAEGQMPEWSATFTMASFVINLLVGAWISLIWSRFLLGADVPRGLVPSLKGLPFSGFLISLLLIVGLIAVVNLAIGFIETFFLMAIPLLVGLIVVPLVTTGLSIWLILRLGAALPATAAGQVLSLYQAWVGSRDKGIWLVAILALVVLSLLNFPSALLAGIPILGSIIGVFSSWLVFMIGTGWLVAIFRTIPSVPK